jgi:hypothetical protein
MGLRHYHLAQVNVARMLAPLASPVMAEFVSQLPVVNRAADDAPGFVWRLMTPAGDATAVEAYDDPLILFNLSVWESIGSLKSFTYGQGHLAAFRNRAQWFERPALPHLALWWIPAGHLPSIEEAVNRLEYRRTHGDTPVAFALSHPHPAPEEPAAEPVPPLLNFDRRQFISAANSPNGDVNAETRFHYRQSGVRVWATYAGGRVRFGALVAVGDCLGRLDMRYHHVTREGTLRTGSAIATPEKLNDGRLRLTEDWRWTNGDRSAGRSVVEEIPAAPGR